MSGGVVPSPARQPARPLTFWMAVALVMGNMIGSGIFLLPASLARFGGVSLIGWLISTAGALMLALVFARLARIDPASGGPYAYTRRAFGDLAGFLVAWGYWISMWTSLGALAVALVGYLAALIPPLNATPAVAAGSALIAVWSLVAVNVIGARAAGWVQVVTTVLKLFPLVLVAVLGLTHFDSSRVEIAGASVRTLATDVPAVVALTLWAFLGLESATIPAASIERPDISIPRATVVGTVIVAIVYVASTVGVMSLVPREALGISTAPFVDAARTQVGDWAAGAVAAGAGLSCFGALNGWTLLAGQLPLAVARDGLFPGVFARISRRGTPAAGLIIAGVLTTALVLLNYTRGLVELFTFFILLSTLNTLIPYVFSSLALFLVPEGGRETLPRGIAAAAILAFAYSLWAMAGAGAETIYWGFLLLIAGLPVYVFLVRRSSG
jgi:basic amino acid/polyamine antiporter, APA family